MKCRFLYFVFILNFGSYCVGQTSAGIVHRFFNNFEDSTLNAEWMNSNTIILSDDSAKNHFSRTDEKNHYSSGIEIAIPADLRQKNFKIYINGLIRSTNLETKSQMVVSFSRADSAVFWKGDYLPDSSGKVNEWNEFKVSTLIPRNIPEDSKLKIFLWNDDGKYATDLDDLDISITEVHFPSYLPK